MPTTLTGNNQFHEGWLRGALGLPKSDAAMSDIERAAYEDGYAMGMDTTSLHSIRLVLSEMRQRGQIKVEP